MEASEFWRRAEPLLMRDEARHNLILGIAGTLVAHPDYYPDASTWLVENLGLPVAAAVMTPPHNLVLADARGADAIDALIEAISRDAPTIPGVIGNRPSVDWFVEKWTSRCGLTPTLIMAQGVFTLRTVNRGRPVKGEFKRAGAAQRSLVLGWSERFNAEVFPNAAGEAHGLEAAVDFRLNPDLSNGLWIWTVDDEPVSMAGYGGQTPNGVRVGPVYTPPDRRGFGYATALVASMSEWLLKEQGRRFCFLYTDLANPTSNEIYRRIGYQQVAESAQYEFG